MELPYPIGVAFKRSHWKWHVLITKRFQRRFKRLPLHVQPRIVDAIETLAMEEDPTRISKKLRGNHYGQYSYRIGNYRIIYDIVRDEIIVLRFIEVGVRRSIY